MPSPLQIALVAGLSTLALGALAKPIEGGLARMRQSQRKAWWRRRRAREKEAFERKKSERMH